METYNNPVLEMLPAHLKKYVVSQQYARYTPIDQAIWRYVMRQNYAYLKDVAYYPYIPGLRKAGLTIEKVPDLQLMNNSLQQIGWGAATVDGFIPPAAFMEFQAHRVLVVAADIRQIDHIEYTPAPDIIHESSGHAPIIGEPEYAEYLQYFGEVGSKAMFSAKDFELYEAIRYLSILKESSRVELGEIEAAEAELDRIQNTMGEPSEMALLSRLHWWTVEYGLIGTIENPKIYGAGLLSSIGESASCMRESVPKIPYTIDAINYSYDITKPQPQLFVTPDFAHLRTVLDAYADTMSFRIGGKQSVDKAIACGNVCTLVYSSGLQVSGVFQHVDGFDQLDYIKTSGPTALAINGLQIDGHGKDYHSQGFGSPVGRLLTSESLLEDLSDEGLKEVGVVRGQNTILVFESGIVVWGRVEQILRKDSKIVLISFSSCHVVHQESRRVLFEPEWGIYDMAVGDRIVSVFSGAGDKAAFEQDVSMSETKTVIPDHDQNTKLLHDHYATIRSIREKNQELDRVHDVYRQIQLNFPDEWLLLVEILELAAQHNAMEFIADVENRLSALKLANPHLQKLIDDGIRLARDTEIKLLL